MLGVGGTHLILGGLLRERSAERGSPAVCARPGPVRE
jgi:hypothetical protein